jgi:hypothetical protein
VRQAYVDLATLRSSGNMLPNGDFHEGTDGWTLGDLPNGVEASVTAEKKPGGGFRALVNIKRNDSRSNLWLHTTLVAPPSVAGAPYYAAFRADDALGGHAGYVSYFQGDETTYTRQLGSRTAAKTLPQGGALTPGIFIAETKTGDAFYIENITFAPLARDRAVWWNAPAAPPRVAIVSPAAGATLPPSEVQVVAQAYAPAGIAGVRFLLDGAALGAEVTRPPYAVTWDARSAPGSHVLVAVARDGAGQERRSEPVRVLVGVPSDSGPGIKGRTRLVALRGAEGSPGGTARALLLNFAGGRSQVLDFDSTVAEADVVDLKGRVLGRREAASGAISLELGPCPSGPLLISGRTSDGKKFRELAVVVR